MTAEPGQSESRRSGLRSGRGSLLAEWWYSVSLLALYVLLFVLWKTFPSRVFFVAGGVGMAALMAIGFAVARRHAYFVNRADASVHVLVILDVLLEALAAEFARLWLNGPTLGQLATLHDNYNFLGCAAAFAALIGGHRYWMLARRDAATPAGSDT